MTDRSKLLNDIATGNYWGAGVTFQRSNAVPLEKYSIFGSLEEARDYVANNGVAYPGQIISILAEDGNVRNYSIDGSGKLQLLATTIGCSADCFGLSLKGVHFDYNGYIFDTFGCFGGNPTDSADNIKGEVGADGTTISSFSLDDSDISGRPGWYYLTTNDTVTEEVVQNLVGKTFGIYFRSNRYSGAVVTHAFVDSTLIENTTLLIIKTDNMFLPKNWNTKLKDETAWPIEKGYVYFRDFPAVGDVLISNATSVSGSNNTAILYGATSEGYNNISEGKYAHTEGRGNYASYCAHTEGNKNYAYGFNSHAQGYDCRNVAQAGHVGGYSSIAGCGWNTVVKPASTPDEEAVDHTNRTWLYVGGDLSTTLTLNKDTIAIYDTQNRLWQYSSSKVLTSMSVYDTDDGKKTTKLTFSGAVFTPNFSDWYYWKIMFPLHPEVGDSGIETASSRSAFTHGTYAITAGSTSATFGHQNYNIGNYNFVTGQNNKALGNNLTVIGTGLTATKDGQVVLGSYNTTDSDASFILGGGTSNTPKNALVLREDGLHTDLVGSGDSAIINRKALQESLNEVARLGETVDRMQADLRESQSITYFQKQGFITNEVTLSSDPKAPELLQIKNGLLKICEGSYPKNSLDNFQQITADNGANYIMSTTDEANLSENKTFKAFGDTTGYNVRINKSEAGTGSVTFQVKPSITKLYDFGTNAFIFETKLGINDIGTKAATDVLQFTIKSVSESPLLLLIRPNADRYITVTLNSEVFTTKSMVGEVLDLKLVYSIYYDPEISSLVGHKTSLWINGEIFATKAIRSGKTPLDVNEAGNVCISVNNNTIGSFDFRSIQCYKTHTIPTFARGADPDYPSDMDEIKVLWELPAKAYEAIEAVYHYSKGCTVDLTSGAYIYPDENNVGMTISKIIPELANIDRKIDINSSMSTSVYSVVTNGGIDTSENPLSAAGFAIVKSWSDRFIRKDQDSTETQEMSGSLKVYDKLLAGSVVSTASICSTSGDILAPCGCVEAQHFNALSDARLKENFRPVQTPGNILDLPVYEYDFIDGVNNQIGCKAQDLQEICPQIVHENDNGYLSIQESKIVYLLLEEIKKLRSEVDRLNNRFGW